MYFREILAREHQGTFTVQFLELEFIKTNNSNNKPKHHKQKLKVNVGKLFYKILYTSEKLTTDRNNNKNLIKILLKKKAIEYNLWYDAIYIMI